MSEDSKSQEDTKLSPRKLVVLKEIPRGLLDGPPAEDQSAISDIIGKPIRFKAYDGPGIAELEFTDDQGVIRFIYVNVNAVSPAS